MSIDSTTNSPSQKLNSKSIDFVVFSELTQRILVVGEKGSSFGLGVLDDVKTLPISA